MNFVNETATRYAQPPLRFKSSPTVGFEAMKQADMCKMQNRLQSDTSKRRFGPSGHAKGNTILLRYTVCQQQACVPCPMPPTTKQNDGPRTGGAAIPENLTSAQSSQCGHQARGTCVQRVSARQLHFMITNNDITCGT
jgi:hypothetical protein